MIRQFSSLCLLSLIVSQFSGCMGIMGGAGGCGAMGGGFSPFAECVGDVQPIYGGYDQGPRPSLLGRLNAGGCGCQRQRGCGGAGFGGPGFGGRGYGNQMYAGGEFVGGDYGSPMMTADAGWGNCETCGDGGGADFGYGNGGMVYDGNMMPMQSGMNGGCSSCQQSNAPMQPIPHQVQHYGDYSGQQHGLPNAPLPPVGQQLTPTPAQPMAPQDANANGDYFAPPITTPGPTTMMPQQYMQPQMMGQPMMSYSGMPQGGSHYGMMAPQMEMSPQMMQPQMMNQPMMNQPAVQQTYYTPPAVQAF